MKFFVPPTPLVLYSDFSPDECARRLSSSIDVEQRAMFGFSGYHGSKPFLGWVYGKDFRILQRVYRLRNSFPPVLSGEFQPQKAGTRVQGIFDLELTSKIAICVFGVAGPLLMTLILILTYRSQPVLSIACTIGYSGLVVSLPRIVRGFGRDEERNIAAFLREILMANDSSSSLSSDCDS